MLKAHKINAPRKIKAKMMVDSCVLIDTFDTSSPNHNEADSFVNYVASKGVMFQMPMHAWYEMNCTLKRLVKEKKEHLVIPLFNGLPGIKVEFVHLDGDFLENYKDVDVAVTKGADNIFLVIAKKNNLQLVTFDDKMIKAAEESGIDVYTPGEWMSKYAK